MASAIKVSNIYSAAQNTYGQASYGRLDKNEERAAARQSKNPAESRRFFKDVLKEEISKRDKR